jgi:hypothetical protein
VQHVTRLDRYFISSIKTLSSQFTSLIFTLLSNMEPNSRKIFTLQKKIIRIMIGTHPRTSCRRLFKKLEILPVQSQYIYSLMKFFVNNQENFQTNLSINNINTRNKHQLHRPTANLSCFQKNAFYSGIRIFNSITNLKNEKTKFKVTLKKYLNAHSFYSVDEFLACTDDLKCWLIRSYKTV